VVIGAEVLAVRAVRPVTVRGRSVLLHAVHLGTKGINSGVGSDLIGVVLRGQAAKDEGNSTCAANRSITSAMPEHYVHMY
jgi:hypothetical protein